MYILVENVLFDLGIEGQCVKGEHVHAEVRGDGGLGLLAGGIRASHGTFSSYHFCCFCLLLELQPLLHREQSF